MKEKFRASIRLLLFFLVSFLTILFVGLGNVFFKLFRLAGTVRWKNLVIGGWAAITAKIIGLDIRVDGTPPDPPFFLVSNHLSYIDVVPLWYFLDATFIAKSEIKSWPFFGWGTRTLGVLFINRELKRDVERMNNCIADTISEQQGVILFPEGTSSKGEEVLPFNGSLLNYPAENRMPVSVASITYHSCNPERPAHQNICWWGDMPFLPHFWELLKIKTYKVKISFGDNIVSGNRKELAEKLQTAVIQKFTPVTTTSETVEN